MRVLNVAEKPSVAKAISEILSQGHCSKVGGLRGLICGESWADGPPLEPSEAHPVYSLTHLFSVDSAAAAASAGASRSTIRFSSSATP